MKFGKKEIFIGVLFAIFIAIFINYASFERIISRTTPSEQSLYPLTFSLIWYISLSILYYFFYSMVFNIFRKDKQSFRAVVVMLLGAIVISHIMSELYPIIREALAPEGVTFRRPPRTLSSTYLLDSTPLFDSTTLSNISLNLGGQGQGQGGPNRELSSAMFKHSLVLVLNLFFINIQRLIYTNQSIARRNEQLQLETIKSQHASLLQQINPHFFFNSLNLLRYTIMKNENENAIEYLDNLTTIFRKTLKVSGNKLHSLSEELEITTSYIYVIEKRFEGKFTIEFDTDTNYENHMIAPLSLITLVENVVKHNKIAVKDPVKVKIYTNDNDSITIENNIVPKFEEVEKNGIGLLNLDQQYNLLTNKGIIIYSDDKIFKVTLPLIAPTV